MPNDTRAARRQKARGGPHHHEPPRDPMVPVYIGIGVIIVAVFVVFGIIHWQQTNAIKAAYATPTPVAIPSGKATPEPIRLEDRQVIGAPYFKLAKGQLLPDTPLGGLGKPVDGIECGSMEGQSLHIHTQLTMYNHGKQIQLPQYIGIAQPKGTAVPCLYWIHTHFYDGIIHVESPELTAPQGGGPYTLGLFFDIWGRPLSPTNLAGIKGDVTAYVNGTKYDGDPRDIPLLSHQEVTLEVGTPLVPPPSYLFPPDD
jgi:hypothetical protein